MRIKLSLLLAAVLLLSACAASNAPKEEGGKEPVEKEQEVVEKEPKPESESEEKIEGKVVDSFEIDFSSAVELASDGKKVVQLNFKVRNGSADTRLFDSFVFDVENKEGKTLEIAPKDNYSGELKPAETQEGSVYYYLEGSAPLKITYNDLETDNKESWEIKEIEK